MRTGDERGAIFDREPALTSNYEKGPRWFIPGYDLSHALAAMLLRERLGESGRILVIGAGGGVELSVFAAESAGWRFVGVDPSTEMLEMARQRVESVGASDRVSLVKGYIPDAPRERFDAATAFLVLNFIPDDGSRLDVMREIHSRLAPSGSFLMINACSEKGGPRYEEDLRLYEVWARRNGAPDDVIAAAVRMQRDTLHPVPFEREEALLGQAGFHDSRVFYRGLWVCGWLVSA